MPSSIDFTALTTPLPPEQVRAWKAQAVASGAPWARLQPAEITALAIGAPFLLLFVATGMSMIGTFASTAAQSSFPAAAIMPVILGLIMIVALGGAVFTLTAPLRKTWELWARVDAFARANGMTFSPRDDDPAYPGTIFGLGRERHAVDHLRAATGRYLDFGNYRYTTGSGKSRRTHTWGFLAFHLDRRMPHMMLDSTANNSLLGSNLPVSFRKDQILSLEGDFDRHFTLYCPREYERDALYVFTPDLMALLIDEAAPFDVEIVDDWMFVYSSRPFGTGDANLYARLFRIMDTVGAKTLRQTDRYLDERVGTFAANVVAPQGARLTRRISVGAIVVFAAIVAIWIWGIASGFIHR
ncbi:MAG: hypothetical protein R2717_02525 [Schumannella sp.]